MTTDDEKYHKRTVQRQQRLRQSLLTFGASLVVLVYTWRTMWDIPEHAESRRRAVLEEQRREQLRAGGAGGGGGQQLDAQGRRRRPMEQPQRQPQDRKRKNQESQGLFGRLFGADNIAQFEPHLQELEQRVLKNENHGTRWVRDDLLPSLSAGDEKPSLESTRDRRQWGRSPQRYFAVRHLGMSMAWETHANQVNLDQGPAVDYTQHSYQYPTKLYELPKLGEYPPLVPLKELMQTWPQDELDHPPNPIQERLVHFDYTNPHDLEAAKLFRDAKLPFKLVNVPEVVKAGQIWTDAYVSQNFDSTHGPFPQAQGTCQESADNFFAFFTQPAWPVSLLGVPPTRNSDYTFAKWARHAKYADAVRLDANQPHMYFQAGVDKEERHLPKKDWTFISRDLPSFSSPTETFFVFDPSGQKGIQCRFGERGVTAATHFDSGRNMVAMVTGAKRYILSPPSQCTKLAIVTSRGHPIFRHSMLNFGHLKDLDNADMPEGERAWLERAGDAMALDTVLKAGEVLYIPSHWFHYITSLQKSGQCNVRSGVDVEGDAYFGGRAEVVEKCEAAYY